MKDPYQTSQIILNWTKSLASLLIPIVIVVLPLLFSTTQKRHELSLKYTELAVDILRDKESSLLRGWAVGILQENSASFTDKDAQNLTEGTVSFPPELLVLTDTHIEVPVSSFVRVVVESGQATDDAIRDFLTSAYKMLQKIDANEIDHQHLSSWDISVNGGSVFIYRTKTSKEFERALTGVISVLEAMINDRDIDGVSVRIRGNERFYDIRGLSGIGSGAWVGLDRRATK